MHLQAITERFKVIHWMWWAVWLVSVALLGFLIATHPSVELKVLAESFRPDVLPLPVHIILHRGLADMAGYTFCVSTVLVIVAVFRPREAPYLVPLAVGLALLFFAFHTLSYSQTLTQWMRATAHTRTATP
ncbi:MAG: hypothetical protein IPK22_05100 [Verrucomicrobiaceae bacterium]|nr:hypothetical protein [Verrucomicrobiaceae bacterium]